MGEGAKIPEAQYPSGMLWLYMWPVDGVKVTRLTLGGLDICLVLGPSRDGPMNTQESAEASSRDASTV